MKKWPEAKGYPWFEPRPELAEHARNRMNQIRKINRKNGDYTRYAHLYCYYYEVWMNNKDK